MCALGQLDLLSLLIPEPSEPAEASNYEISLLGKHFLNMHNGQLHLVVPFTNQT
jgi:hypothetical protein